MGEHSIYLKKKKTTLMFSSQDYQGQVYLNKIDSDSKQIKNFFGNKFISRINNMQCYMPQSYMFIHSLLSLLKRF